VIFVDTSFWVALRNGRDPHNAMAKGLLARHGDSGLVTTSHVRGETWTYLRRRAGHASAVAFLDALERSPRLEVVFVDEELEREALRWLRRRDEREYSFVDATSFAAMRSLRVREALAFDGDFSAAGFVELRAGADPER
jgi:predicted nucleic acid-binding protein